MKKKHALTNSSKKIVFLSHVSEDKPRVEQLFERLRDHGFDPWLDRKGGLKPGDQWQSRIKQALRKANFVVVCLSRMAVKKKGYFQTEIRIALEIQNQMPDGEVFLIPCTLEECDVPPHLEEFHRVPLFDEYGNLDEPGYEELRQTLETGTRRLIDSGPSVAEPKNRKTKSRQGGKEGMRNRHVDWSEDDGLHLGALIEDAGLSQKALSNVAKVSQSWLSQVRKGHRKSVDAMAMERTASVLVTKLQGYQAEGAFAEEKFRGALGFLSRFTSVAVDLLPPKACRPGDRVSVDATNYVRRQDDEDVRDALADLQPFTMIVRGPVQCGKSSLLARLEHKALQAGVETAWFDPLPRADATADISATASILLSEELQAQWGLEPPHHGLTDSIPKLVNWLLKALGQTAAKPRLLVLDDLASLGTRVVEDWLSLLVRALHNKRATLGINLSIAVGFTHHFGSYFSRKLLELSSMVHWWPMVELGWFSQEEVERLEATAPSSLPAVDDLYGLFAGQPYLTHAAVADAAFRKSVREWIDDPTEVKARPVRGARPYRRHVHMIKLAILGPTLEVGDEARSLLRSFIEACNGGVPGDPDHKLFFQTARLLNEDGRPALGIYSLIAEDLGELIGR